MLSNLSFIVTGILLCTGVAYEIKTHKQKKRISHFHVNVDDHFVHDSEVVLSAMRTINEGLKVLQSSKKE